MKPLLVGWITASAIATTCGPASAGQAYRVQSIHPQGALWSAASDITDDGTLLISADFGNGAEALMMHGATVTRLAGVAGAESVAGIKMSLSGTIVGYSLFRDTTSSGEEAFMSRGAIWEDGHVATFELPGSSDTSLLGISPNGRYIVGTSSISGFRYDRDTNQAFMLADGLSHAGESFAWATAVDDDGVVLVRATRVDPNDGSATRIAYLYDPDSGTTKELSDPSFGSIYTLWDFNSRGQFAGWRASSDAADPYEVGVVGYDGAFSDIRGELGSTVLHGINESGIAVGWTSDPMSGIQYAVMAVPVPEPQTWAMLGVGILLLIGNHRHRELQRT